MALLTAEDVLNKAFSKTKYREGFDQDEVDDFLDEVASTIASLTAERDQLAAQLAQGGGAIASATTYGAAAGAAPATEGAGLLAAATDPNPPSAPSMIAMAQKLHDEYVTAGEAEKEQIIADARAEAAELLSKAERDARDKLVTLEGERAELEGKIDDLRRFERDYRGHLKNYLENLLGDIEHGEQRSTGAIQQATAPAATAPAATAPAVTAPAVTPSSSEPASGAVPLGAAPVSPATPAVDEPASGSFAEVQPSDAPTGAVPEQVTSGITPMPQWPTT